MFELSPSQVLRLNTRSNEGANHFDRYFTGVAVTLVYQDVQILLHFTVCVSRTEKVGTTWKPFQLNAVITRGARSGPFGKLARLEHGCVRLQQTNTGFKRNHDRQAAAQT